MQDPVVASAALDADGRPGCTARPAYSTTWQDVAPRNATWSRAHINSVAEMGPGQRRGRHR
jgi:hypothetical protein